jgi:hypothetical protein
VHSIQPDSTLLVRSVLQEVVSEALFMATPEPRLEPRSPTVRAARANAKRVPNSRFF